jgi:hypothetical protein
MRSLNRPKIRFDSVAFPFAAIGDHASQRRADAARLTKKKYVVRRSVGGKKGSP